MASNFWFKFNFKDWSDDVKPLSLLARGLLLELIIYMRRPEQSGIMPNDVKLISRLTGGLTEEITEGLTEIKNFGMLNFEKNESGQEILISRRLIKEFEISKINSNNGLLGGNPKLKPKKIRLSGGLSEPDKRTPNSNSISNSDSINEIVFPFASELFLKTWELWKQYKLEQHKFTYKGSISEQAALNELSKMTEERAIAAIKHSISNSYKGIFEPNKKEQHGKLTIGTHRHSTDFSGTL